MAELLNALDVDAVLGKNGVIREQVADFSVRTSQLEMARLIAQSIDQKSSHVIEASTGIGKSFAYLVPVFLSAKKVVISTGTKNLQDQLFFKDIPVIQKSIISAQKTALLKGRSNYCCLHRLALFKHQKKFQGRKMAALFGALSEWTLETKTGDISEFSAIPENDPLWFHATSNADNCLGGDCPEMDQCFVAKARKKAMDADVVVINHHLYFSDSALKQEGFGEILPEAAVLIFDEAHQLPEIASHFYGTQLSMRQIESLCRDTLAAELLEASDSQQLREFTDQLLKSSADFRLLLGQFVNKSDWADIQFAPQVQQGVKEIEESISVLLASLKILASRGKDLASCHQRLENMQQNLSQFLTSDDNEQVHWYEWSDRSFQLMLSPLEVSDLFREQLEHSAFESVFFTSATLSNQQSFKYYSDRMGLEGIKGSCFESPFDYQKQSVLYVPDDLPNPSDAQYAKAFGQRCRELIQATDGYCFILFTSYRMLTWIAEYLSDHIENPLFVQGSYQRSALLRQYLETDRAVLLGTSSFWEGIDVKGDQLRCVIIDKLPFKSPQDPVYKKRLQRASRQGRNAFVDIQIPETSISLRQGVGRLIRDVNDRGIVALCDNRLHSQSYGKAMLGHLPPMKFSRDMAEVRQFAMDRFKK